MSEIKVTIQADLLYGSVENCAFYSKLPYCLAILDIEYIYIYIFYRFWSCFLSISSKLPYCLAILDIEYIYIFYRFWSCFLSIRACIVGCYKAYIHGPFHNGKLAFTGVRSKKVQNIRPLREYEWTDCCDFSVEPFGIFYNQVESVY